MLYFCTVLNLIKNQVIQEESATKNEVGILIIKNIYVMKNISNWGNYPVVKANITEVVSYSTIREYVLKNREVIARGNGRCYGDSSLGINIFSTCRLNKFLRFDDINGCMECEAGVLLSDVLEVIVPQGFFLYVTPGTRFITVGGAIASDVHGKNHHVEGCFSEWVLNFKLMDENGEIHNCSRTENPIKFWSTVGGMGLTGIILSASFRLRKIETPFILQETIKAKNLNEIFALFEESANRTYSVAWIDCLKRGRDTGRSILFRGEHLKETELTSDKRASLHYKRNTDPLNIPFFFPGFVLNRFTIKLFNWFYFSKQFRKKTGKIVDYWTFFYPLDILNNWNRIYGKKGFIQDQMVIPKEHGEKGMRKILETVSRKKQGSFLAVLKLFGKNNPMAYNSFPVEGYTLALDFKISRKLKHLVNELDSIVEEFGGRIYLAKDSMSKPEITNYLKNTDSAKFISIQSKRINVNDSAIPI